MQQSHILFITLSNISSKIVNCTFQSASATSELGCKHISPYARGEDIVESICLVECSVIKADILEIHKITVLLPL